MYGYVLPDKATIKNEEFILYTAFYCGLCKSIGKSFGQISRNTINYDTAFFAALIFDQLNYPVEFKLESCIGNPFKKKAMIQNNPLMTRIADLNMLLVYFKAEDNVNDKEFGAKAIRRFFIKHRQKAALREPELASAVEQNCNRLRELELSGEKNLDLAADCFAALMRDCAKILLKEAGTKENLGLFYNIGKFIYLADALDDTHEDYKKKRYNPFLACFGVYKSRQTFIQEHYKQLEFIFASTVNRAIECFNVMDFHQSYGLLENIIYYGLRKKVDELFKSEKKLKKPKY